MEINSLLGLSRLTGGKTGSLAVREPWEQSGFQQTLAQIQKLQDAPKQAPHPVSPGAAASPEEGETEDAKLLAACQEIEALFIQQLWKQMRATVPKAGLIPESMAGNLYQEMLDAEYSKLMARSSQSKGIAEMLYKQLSRKSNNRITTTE